MSGWSLPLVLLVDLAIFLAITVIFVMAVRSGDLKKGRMPRLGRLLLLSGIGLTGLFFLVDFSSVFLLPRVADEHLALDMLMYLRAEVSPVFTLLALCLIGAGLLHMARQRREVEREILDSENKVASVQREIIQSEIRFRSLIEQTPDALYCLEFSPGLPIDLPVYEQIDRSYDAVLVECNQAFADAFQLASTSQAIGMRFGEFDSTKDKKAHEAFLRAFIENDYRLEDYDLEYLAPDGTERSLQVSLTGIVESGKLLRIWGAEIDTLEKKRVERALFERRRFQEFQSALSSRLIKSSDHQLPDVVQQCLQDTCIYFGYDRVSIIWFDQEHDRADAVFYWNEHGGPPTVDASFENYPWLGPKVFGGELITVSHPDDLPAEAAIDAEHLRKLGLGALIAVPLATGEDSIGVLTFGDLTAGRTWSEQELTDLRVIADLFTTVVSRVMARQSLDRALDELRDAKERLEAEKVYLMQEISSSHGFDEIIGESPQLKRCLRQVSQVAATTTSVLIQGETGTGKELIARAIHKLSDRSERPLVKVNCAALPANLIESELFGHEKGAFTGALAAKRGRFDLADKGTLFLDEIGDFPLDLQGKLLRVLQEGEFQRLGGTKTFNVDVRIIAATNRDLLAAVDSGDFRADLFYRINTFPIYVPKLSERIGDIPILVEHFAEKHGARLGKDVSAISADFMEKLNEYDWPGNIRELEGIIQQALISSNGATLEAPDSLTGNRPEALDPALTARPIAELVQAERQHIEKALDETRWVIGGSTGAAAKLGLPPSTLRSKMKKLGIERPEVHT